MSSRSSCKEDGKAILCRNELAVEQNNWRWCKDSGSNSCGRYGPDIKYELKPSKYPRAVFFIFSNEFCERFSYYGMKSILTLYMYTELNYDTVTTTQLYHLFLMLSYVFAIFGGIVGDACLGKYKTIIYFSLIYAFGNILMTLSSVTVLNLPPRILALLGLLCVGVGAGGIKPNVCPFGGDQFVLPRQKKQFLTYFSIFYFSINVGSLLSTMTIPILRSDVHCFGKMTCFPLAFGLPVVLMFFSITIFLIGTPLYVMNNPTKNIIGMVLQCILRALRNKIFQRKQSKNHWLEYADDKYDSQQIYDIKAVLNVLLLFIPIPLFWALYDQQGSRWVFQATRMDGRVFGFTIRPDQMHMFCPLLVLILIPSCEICIYPLLRKIGLTTALRKIGIGGFCTALSFLFAAVLEFYLKKTYPVIPGLGEGQIRLFNSLNCSVLVQSDRITELHIAPLSSSQILHYPTNGSEISLLNISTDTLCDIQNRTWHSKIKVAEQKSISYVISATEDGYVFFKQWQPYDILTKDPNGLVKLRIFYSGFSMNISQIKLVGNKANKEIAVNNNKLDNFTFMEPGKYRLYLNNKSLNEDVNLLSGGIYTLILRTNIHTVTNGNLIEMVSPNSINILWQLPQIIMISVGEVLVSITGLEFAYTETPGSLKAVVSAAWLLCTGLGNLIVVIISKIVIFENQIWTYIFFAGLMLIDMTVFTALAVRHTYITEDTYNS